MSLEDAMDRLTKALGAQRFPTSVPDPGPVKHAEHIARLEKELAEVRGDARALLDFRKGIIAAAGYPIGTSKSLSEFMEDIKAMRDQAYESRQTRKDLNRVVGFLQQLLDALGWPDVSPSACQGAALIGEAVEKARDLKAFSDEIRAALDRGWNAPRAAVVADVKEHLKAYRASIKHAVEAMQAKEVAGNSIDTRVERCRLCIHHQLEEGDREICLVDDRACEDSPFHCGSMEVKRPAEVQKAGTVPLDTPNASLHGWLRIVRCEHCARHSGNRCVKHSFHLGSSPRSCSDFVDAQSKVSSVPATVTCDTCANYEPKPKPAQKPQDKPSASLSLEEVAEVLQKGVRPILAEHRSDLLSQLDDKIDSMGYAPPEMVGFWAIALTKWFNENLPKPSAPDAPEWAKRVAEIWKTGKYEEKT